jgi:hypothetical protein
MISYLVPCPRSCSNSCSTTFIPASIVFEETAGSFIHNERLYGPSWETTHTTSPRRAAHPADPQFASLLLAPAASFAGLVDVSGHTVSANALNTNTVLHSASLTSPTQSMAVLPATTTITTGPLATTTVLDTSISVQPITATAVATTDPINASTLAPPTTNTTTTATASITITTTSSTHVLTDDPATSTLTHPSVRSQSSLDAHLNVMSPELDDHLGADDISDAFASAIRGNRMPLPVPLSVPVPAAMSTLSNDPRISSTGGAHSNPTTAPPGSAPGIAIVTTTTNSTMGVNGSARPSDPVDEANLRQSLAIDSAVRALSTLLTNEPALLPTKLAPASAWESSLSSSSSSSIVTDNSAQSVAHSTHSVVVAASASTSLPESQITVVAECASDPTLLVGQVTGTGMTEGVEEEGIVVKPIDFITRPTMTVERRRAQLTSLAAYQQYSVLGATDYKHITPPSTPLQRPPSSAVSAGRLERSSLQSPTTLAQHILRLSTAVPATALLPATTTLPPPSIIAMASDPMAPLVRC